MELIFLAPSWSWLLLAPLLVLVFRSAPRSARFLAPIRAVVLALVVGALLHPVLLDDDDREHLAIVVDASASVADRLERSAALRELVARSGRRDETHWVVFGERAKDRALRDEIRALGDSASFTVVDDGSGSPLSSALAAAARAIPDGARGAIVVFSDGSVTDRRFSGSVPELVERGLPVSVVKLASATKPARFTSLEPRGRLRVGRTGQIDIELTGDVTSARVELRDEAGVEIASEEVGFDGGEGTVTFEWEPDRAGFVALEARVDGVSERRTVGVDPPLAVLHVGERVVGAAGELQTAIGRGFSITDWNPRSSTAPALDRFDLVVLDDAPAAALSSEFLSSLDLAVRDSGIGLFACGGAGAFGPGGWDDTLLRDLLPVNGVQKEEKRDPSTALVIIIDTSGSMAGERVQLAKEVARLAMMRLLPHDKVGIVEFFGGKRWAAPIQPASNSIDLARAINRLDAGGGTVILPAIEEAWYGMQNVETRYKHVLVLTDGGVESGAFEPLLRRMADDGVNTSTVLIGPEAHSEFLVDLANWGKGRFYSVPDRFNLPEILLKQPSTSRLPSFRPGEFKVKGIGAESWLGALDLTAAPPVLGFVETEAKPEARTILELEGERAPLLATWQNGAGRVTTLSTEAMGPSATPWREFAGELLARVFERTAGDDPRSFAFELTRRGSQTRLIARRRHAGESVPLANLEFIAPETSATPAAPTGSRVEKASFEERADGVFVAEIPVAAEVELRVTAGGAGEIDRTPTYLVSAPRADERHEMAVAPSLALDLAALARKTGGGAFAAGDPFDPPHGTGATRQRSFDLRPGLVSLAILLWLLEILHRRRDRIVGTSTAGDAA